MLGDEFFFRLDFESGRVFKENTILAKTIQLPPSKHGRDWRGGVAVAGGEVPERSRRGEPQQWSESGTPESP